MEKIELITTQKPGIVSFDNYEVIKENLTRYVEESFKDIDYSVQGYEAAKTDCDELKQTKDIISKTAKEGRVQHSELACSFACPQEVRYYFSNQQ